MTLLVYCTTPETPALGRLLIDEAGQAVPQSAIGAIWRAKKVLAVSDPLQIEPVFTVPSNLVDELAKHYLTNEYEKWAPSVVSIQNLADDANIFGAHIENNNQLQ